MKTYLLLTTLFFLTISCSSDSDEDELIPPVDNDVAYTTTVKNIIDSNCLDCHRTPPRNGASISLTNLEEVRDAVLNRGLIERVESGSMPPVGDPLTASEVQSLKDWETGGFQE